MSFCGAETRQILEVSSARFAALGNMERKEGKRKATDRKDRLTGGRRKERKSRSPLLFSLVVGTKVLATLTDGRTEGLSLDGMGREGKECHGKARQGMG